MKTDRKLFGKVLDLAEGKYLLVDLTTPEVVAQGYKEIPVNFAEGHCELGEYVSGYWSDDGKAIYIEDLHMVSKDRDINYFFSFKPTQKVVDNNHWFCWDPYQEDLELPHTLEEI